MNKKGFFIALITLTIFLTSILLLNSNYSIKNNNNYITELTQAKINITNYELLLNQFVKNCDWTNPILLQECIDSNSAKIITQLFNQNLICQNVNFTPLNEKFEGELNCIQTIIINKNEEFYLELNKKIILRNY